MGAGLRKLGLQGVRAFEESGTYFWAASPRHEGVRELDLEGDRIAPAGWAAPRDRFGDRLRGDQRHAAGRGWRGGASTRVGKTRRMQAAFADHLRHVGRVYPRDKRPRVVLVIDNAPWHRGKAVDEALADNPHLEFYRLPGYSPQLDPVERFSEKLRRRATHTRLFDTLAGPKSSVRASISDFRTASLSGFSSATSASSPRPRSENLSSRSHARSVSPPAVGEPQLQPAR